ncbi:MAG: ABC transporter substrate-binding protein [Acetobacteraceae bacterium]
MPAFRSLSAVVALSVALPLAAHAADPIRIGVIAENSAISGIAIPNGAQIAADEINAKGGVDGRQIELFMYDDHNSAVDAVRAFQRAANQDHVVAVIDSYVSEVSLALEPWAARLKIPTITPGAASDDISARVHADYDHMKYNFQGYLASGFLRSRCATRRRTCWSTASCT